MSTYEELREDGKRDKAYLEYEYAMPDDPCPCGHTDWHCIGTDPSYGADADGRRGTLLIEWECRSCGNVVEVY